MRVRRMWCWENIQKKFWKCHQNFGIQAISLAFNICTDFQIFSSNVELSFKERKHNRCYLLAERKGYFKFLYVFIFLTPIFILQFLFMHCTCPFLLISPPSLNLITVHKTFILPAFSTAGCFSSQNTSANFRGNPIPSYLLTLNSMRFLLSRLAQDSADRFAIVLTC